jgi:hypothetical protein
VAQLRKKETGKYLQSNMERAVHCKVCKFLKRLGEGGKKESMKEGARR